MYERISSVGERCGQAASHGSSRGRKVVIRRTKEWMKRKARCGRVIRSPSTPNAAGGEHSLPCGDTTKSLDLTLEDVPVSIVVNMVPNSRTENVPPIAYICGSSEKGYNSHS